MISLTSNESCDMASFFPSNDRYAWDLYDTMDAASDSAFKAMSSCCLCRNAWMSSNIGRIRGSDSWEWSSYKARRILRWDGRKFRQHDRGRWDRTYSPSVWMMAGFWRTRIWPSIDRLRDWSCSMRAICSGEWDWSGDDSVLCFFLGDPFNENWMHSSNLISSVILDCHRARFLYLLSNKIDMLPFACFNSSMTCLCSSNLLFRYSCSEMILWMILYRWVWNWVTRVPHDPKTSFVHMFHRNIHAPSWNL